MAEPIKSYQDLIAWKKAFGLGCTIHKLAGKLPPDERFGLVASPRRQGRQVASRVAQGYGRGNTGDYLHFLEQARGELYEMDTDLLFASTFEYFETVEYKKVKSELDECERVLAGLIRSLGG